MAKKNNDICGVVGGAFCLFAAFLRTIPLLSNFSFSGLLMPSLWLLAGLCLLTQKKNWLTLVGMLPLTILTVQGAFSPLPTGELKALTDALLCRVFPAAAFGLVWVIFLLNCIGTGGKIRRKLWWLPILLTLPGCICRYGATLPWAEFAVIATVSLWLKPAGK